MDSLLHKNLPMSARISFFYAEYGHLEVDGHAVVLRQGDLLTHLPISTACVIVLMPGTSISHAAVKACAEEGTMILWAGEMGVRCYSAGNPGGANAQHLLQQAALRLDEHSRLMVARRIFQKMFGHEAPSSRSVDQLRGIEGGMVKDIYRTLAQEYGVPWAGRIAFGHGHRIDPVNQAISHANAALYGLTEAVILSMGYSPAIGFVHSGDPRSFVFDVADCIKFDTVVPFAMGVARESPLDLEGRVRRGCRDLFAKRKMAMELVSIIQGLLEASC